MNVYKEMEQQRQNKKLKKKGPIPLQILRAFWGAMIVFCIPGIIITFIVPAFTIQLTRSESGKVDAVVNQNLLLIVPVFRHQLTDLEDPTSRTIDGKPVREHGKYSHHTEAQGVLFLKGKRGGQVEVHISPHSLEDVKFTIKDFIADNQVSSKKLWVVANWKIGFFIPVGILLFALMAFAIGVWYIVTGKPLYSPTNLKN